MSSPRSEALQSTRSEQQLIALLRRIDGAGYGAYKRLKGAWDLGDMSLHVDRVQGDPFAAPSHVRARLDAEVAALPAWCWQTADQRRATADFLTRALAADIDRHSGGRSGSGKSGIMDVERPRQEVLARTSVLVSERGDVEARLVVGLPAAGRRVKGAAAQRLLCDELPDAADAALRACHLDLAALQRHVRAIEDQVALRAALREKGLVGFVGDGSVLPRASGVDPAPMGSRATPFVSPERLAVTLQAPWAGAVRGMAVAEGVTLVVGGGYHGKSTLLRALQLGVYDHVPGDGRELVVCRADAVKVRAEDGRSVRGGDISAFIDNLPGGHDTTAFDTEAASGSTSQAASIVEALELGATTLLIDEDTSATNFMIRDERMQALVARDKEPITPLVQRIGALRDQCGVSVVLVMGGSGDYFDVADQVILMDRYQPVDATDAARAVAASLPCRRAQTTATSWPRRASGRAPLPQSIDASVGSKGARFSARDLAVLRFGGFDIDLVAVEQLVEPAQLRAVGAALLWLKRSLQGDSQTLASALLQWERDVASGDFERWIGTRGDCAMPRRFEVGAALNRLRGLRVVPHQP